MRLQVGEGEGHYEGIEGVEHPTDDLVATTSLREPIVSIYRDKIPHTFHHVGNAWYILPITDTVEGSLMYTTIYNILWHYNAQLYEYSC